MNTFLGILVIGLIIVSVFYIALIICEVSGDEAGSGGFGALCALAFLLFYFMLFRETMGGNSTLALIVVLGGPIAFALYLKAGRHKNKKAEQQTKLAEEIALDKKHDRITNCPMCKGYGKNWPAADPNCVFCNASGTVAAWYEKISDSPDPCLFCEGTGVKEVKAEIGLEQVGCPYCNGTGVTKAQDKIYLHWQSVYLTHNHIGLCPESPPGSGKYICRGTEDITEPRFHNLYLKSKPRFSK